MIQTKSEPLSAQTEIEFRKWLQTTHFQTLLKILNSKSTALTIEALNDALEGDDHEPKLAASNEELRQAQRYSHCVKILTVILEQQTPYEIIKPV